MKQFIKRVNMFRNRLLQNVTHGLRSDWYDWINEQQ